MYHRFIAMGQPSETSHQQQLQKGWASSMDGPGSACCNKKKLYLSYVRPTMEYASLVWHASIREDEATAHERIQASVARAILRAPWRTPKSHLLEQLDWPSVRWRRTVAALVFLHKLVYSVSSPCADSLMPFHTSFFLYPLLSAEPDLNPAANGA